MDDVTDLTKTPDAGPDNRALAVIPKPDTSSKSLTVRTSRELGVSQAKAQALIAKYGEEVVDAALEIRDPDWCTVSLPHFKKMVDGGLKPEEVQRLYTTRSRFNNAKDAGHFRIQLNILQLGNLAHRFPDFREAEEDIQLEMIGCLVKALGKNNNFGNIVSNVIGYAERYGICSLEQLIETSFPDDYYDR